ncbi:MAG TPA: UDP-N-acetylglucosamine 2-epimerase (non-hydrolyzing) [Rhizomicrobium sp.]|jgi:UDP-N-acetylglucosamine 2-epimerase (non-hydrolysing)|nr:UDP-N-acetylglucosamine 2-epimerase (non-hydrolyzing) [Rhizomicrobium sp.]
MRKLLAVVGTRPEAIKMAPLIKRLGATPGLSIAVCSTGQHREMIAQVFDLFGLTPDFDLEVMEPNQKLSSLTGKVIAGMEDILIRTAPDRVLVHGDTTTTMATTLAAYYRQIPVGHVEAGLRTRNIYAPWPEEINRRVTDAIADKLWAPTRTSRENLLRENVPDANIVVTGNTVIDALFDLLAGALADPLIIAGLEERFSFLKTGKKTILVTCHRRESFGEGFSDICAAIAELAKREDVQIVFPIHRNPNVREAFSTLAAFPNVRLIEPLDYLDFVFVMSRCHFALTDSGGVQEEAPSLGKPVLVLRKVTERPEAVEAGTVKLVGTDRNLILKEASVLLDSPAAYAAMSSIHNPYGDGKASERIIASLQQE